MKELFDEIITIFKERISNPFFRYFIISWILWNYKFIYFLFFLDESIFYKIHNLSKFDYLIQNIYFYNTWYCNLWLFVIAPLISTWVLIFILPEFTYLFLDKHNENKKKEDRILYNYKRSVKIKENDLMNLDLENKDIKIKQVQKEEELIEAKKKLEPEFLKSYYNFKNTNFFQYFDKIIKIINLEKWDFRIIWDYWVPLNSKFKIEKDFLSYLITNDLIKESDISDSQYIFTDRWDFFSKKYLSDNGKIYEAANRLAALWVIDDFSNIPTNYKVNDYVERGFLIRVWMNISPIEIVNKCEWKFADVSSSDEFCTYYETALKEWYIKATPLLKPKENVTYKESFDLILKARWLEIEKYTKEIIKLFKDEWMEIIDLNNKLTKWELYKIADHAITISITPNLNTSVDLKDLFG